MSQEKGGRLVRCVVMVTSKGRVQTIPLSSKKCTFGSDKNSTFCLKEGSVNCLVEFHTSKGSAMVTNSDKEKSVEVWEGGRPQFEIEVDRENTSGNQNWVPVASEFKHVVSNGKQFGLKINSHQFFFTLRPVFDILDLSRKVIVEQESVEKALQGVSTALKESRMKEIAQKEFNEIRFFQKSGEESPEVLWHEILESEKEVFKEKIQSDLESAQKSFTARLLRESKGSSSDLQMDLVEKIRSIAQEGLIEVERKLSEIVKTRHDELHTYEDKVQSLRRREEQHRADIREMKSQMEVMDSDLSQYTSDSLKEQIHSLESQLYVMKENMEKQMEIIKEAGENHQCVEERIIKKEEELEKKEEGLEKKEKELAKEKKRIAKKETDLRKESEKEKKRIKKKEQELEKKEEKLEKKKEELEKKEEELEKKGEELEKKEEEINKEKKRIKAEEERMRKKKNSQKDLNREKKTIEKEPLHIISPREKERRREEEGEEEEEKKKKISHPPPTRNGQEEEDSLSSLTTKNSLDDSLGNFSRKRQATPLDQLFERRAKRRHF